MNAMQLMTTHSIPYSYSHYKGMILTTSNHSTDAKSKHELVVKIFENLLSGDVAQFPIDPTDPALPVVFEAYARVWGPQTMMDVVHWLGMNSPSDYDKYKPEGGRASGNE